MYVSLCVPSTANACKRQQLLTKVSIREVAMKDCCMHHCYQLFSWDKMKATCEEMWLGDFCFKSSKKLDAHKGIHVNETSNKVITLANIDVCCTMGCIIHGVSKAEFNR